MPGHMGAGLGRVPGLRYAGFTWGFCWMPRPDGMHAVARAVQERLADGAAVPGAGGALLSTRRELGALVTACEAYAAEARRLMPQVGKKGPQTSFAYIVLVFICWPPPPYSLISSHTHTPKNSVFKNPPCRTMRSSWRATFWSCSAACSR
jgi:hypothetical protein